MHLIVPRGNQLPPLHKKLLVQMFGQLLRGPHAAPVCDHLLSKLVQIPARHQHAALCAVLSLYVLRAECNDWGGCCLRAVVYVFAEFAHYAQLLELLSFAVLWELGGESMQDELYAGVCLSAQSDLFGHL
jgi:hypothetical protein